MGLQIQSCQGIFSCGGKDDTQTTLVTSEKEMEMIRQKNCRKASGKEQPSLRNPQNIPGPVLDYDSLRNKQIVVVEDGAGPGGNQAFSKGQWDGKGNDAVDRQVEVQEVYQHGVVNQPQPQMAYGQPVMVEAHGRLVDQCQPMGVNFNMAPPGQPNQQQQNFYQYMDGHQNHAVPNGHFGAQPQQLMYQQPFIQNSQQQQNLVMSDGINQNQQMFFGQQPVYRPQQEIAYQMNGGSQQVNFGLQQ